MTARAWAAVGWGLVHLLGVFIPGDVMFVILGVELVAGCVLIRLIRNQPNFIAGEQKPTLDELANPDLLVLDVAPARRQLPEPAKRKAIGR